MSSTSILPECYIDTLMINTLVPSKDGRVYNHQKGCPVVAKVMQIKFCDRFAIGIMDNDKKKVKYLDEFELIAETNSLFLHKHKTRHHYIVIISPAAERFILNAAKELNITLEEFDLPNNLEDLKNITKHEISCKENPNLKAAIRGLKEASDFRILKQWIKYMRDTTFSIDIAKLKEIADSH